MSLNPNIFGAAQHEYEGDKAEVREIYPGARTAPRVKTRTRRHLTGSEAGMATAEYAINSGCGRIRRDSGLHPAQR